MYKIFKLNPYTGRLVSVLLIMAFAVIMLPLSACDNASESSKILPNEAENNLSAEVKEDEQEIIVISQDIEEEKGDKETNNYDPTEIIVTVNGIPITRGVFDSQLFKTLDEQSKSSYMLGEEKKTSKFDDPALLMESFTSLLNLELARQEAVRLGYFPSDDKIDQAWADMEKSYGGPLMMEGELKSFGLAKESLRNEIAKIIAFYEWQTNDFLVETAVSQEEVRSFYDEKRENFKHGAALRVSQIHLPVPLLANDEQKKKIRSEAEYIEKVLKAGEDFNYIASKMPSDNEATGLLGDLGWVENGLLHSLLNDEVFKLKPGEMSDMIETPFGFYFFKVFDSRQAGLEDFQDVRGRIVKYLSALKFEKVFDNKIRELNAKADVQILDEALKEIYDTFKADSEIVLEENIE